MSDFAGLRLALSALQAQQRGVATAAQNAANVNTEGYSRQRVDLESIGAPSVPAIFSTYNRTSGGVRVAAITRYRDQFLELRAALEHSNSASLSQQATSMTRIEQLFNEPSDDGIAQQLSAFWSGFGGSSFLHATIAASATAAHNLTWRRRARAREPPTGGRPASRRSTRSRGDGTSGNRTDRSSSTMRAPTENSSP